MLTKHRKFCRRGLTHFDATPILKKSFRYIWLTLYIVLNVKTKKNNFCTPLVLILYFSGNSMKNLLSYCELTDARMSSSEKDLPVMLTKKLYNRKKANLQHSSLSSFKGHSWLTPPSGPFTPCLYIMPPTQSSLNIYY